MKRSLTAATTIVLLTLVGITVATLIVSAKADRPVPITILKTTPVPYLLPEHQEFMKQHYWQG
jgi:hypothetical protein